MFLRRIHVQVIDGEGHSSTCPIAHLDNFCMRSFTNEAAYDDTLPIADGVLEIGNTVLLEDLRASMESWFRRKHFLSPGDLLHVTEQPR